MKGIRGLFVCQRDDRENFSHSRDEISMAVNKLKSKHAKSLLNEEEKTCICNMFEEHDGDEGDDTKYHTDVEGEWLTEKEDKKMMSEAHSAPWDRKI